MAVENGSTLASTLNQRIDPLSMVNQISSGSSIQERGRRARELQPEFLREQSRAGEEKMRAEAAARRTQLEKESQIEKGVETGIKEAGEAQKAVMGQAPERTITAFNPDKAMELATLTAIMGAFVGKISGRAGLKAVQGISEGYRQGQEDLYKREVANYESEVAKYRQKIDEAKMIYDNALKLGQAKRGAELVELKKLEPLLQDSVITAHVRNNDLVSVGKAIDAALKARDEIEQKIIEAGISRSTQAPSLTEVVDPQDSTRMLRVDARIYKGGGLGSPGVFGISGKIPASEAAASQKAEGQRRFNVLLGSLEDMYNKLLESGAITDINKPAAENFGAFISTVGPIQAAQRAFGGDAQTLRDRIQAARSTLIQAITQATGMSSRSLDSNKELDFYLQAATDPTKSYQANIEGIRNLKNLYGKLQNNVDTEQVQNLAIDVFGAYEPQKFAYTLTPDNKVNRTPLTPSMSGTGGQSRQPSEGGFDETKRSRLEELRRKRDQGTLGN